MALLALAAAALLLTACPGNGGASSTFDDGSEETYAGSSSSGSSRSSGSNGSYTANFSFDEFIRLTNSGDTDALTRMFQDDSASSGGAGGEYGVDTLVMSAADLGVPAGGTVTLSITGGDEDYEETATVDDDGNVCFTVPRQRVGSRITISMEVKKADGTVVLSGKKTQDVKAGIEFSIALKNASSVPEDFVLVGDLYVCIHEVTQGEYVQYCSYGGSIPSATYGVGSDYPAYFVSWYDALVYCNKRSMAENLTPCYTISGGTDPAVWGPIPSSSNATWNAASYDPSANGYRLPTEAEWEYAAKGGPANDSYTYSGSNDIDAVAWYSSNSGDGGGSTNKKSHPVKTKEPNSAGIYDMTGNVYEWCWDKPSSSSSTRVKRGGSWSSSASYCEVSNRDNDAPNYRDVYYGFRVVRKAN